MKIAYRITEVTARDLFADGIWGHACCAGIAARAGRGSSVIKRAAIVPGS